MDCIIAIDGDYVLYPSIGYMPITLLASFETIDIRREIVNALRVLVDLGLMCGYLSLSGRHPALETIDVIGVSADVAVRRYDVRSVVSDVGVGRIYPSVRIA